MHFSELDAYYHIATQGDSEAFNVLYKEFHHKAKNLVNLIKNTGNYTGNSVDFDDLIDKIFYRILNEYDPERGTFSAYVEYVLGNRFSANVRSIFITNQATYAPLEEVIEDLPPLETLPDPNQIPMSDDIAINQFKLRISSKGKSRSFSNRMRDRIVILQYAGYKNTEICEILNITYSQLRTHLTYIKNHEDVVNLKLELK